jgi:hypothetical protein
VRSSRRIALGLALAAAGGCDLVLGVDGQTAPCGDESFASAAPTDVVVADSFSLSWARDLIVYESNGRLYEKSLPGGEPTVVDAMVYTPVALALAPEGDALFATAQVETPFLMAAVRTGAASWKLDGVVPIGTIAGTPSAAEFGPRRVLVRLRPLLPEVQEYEADGNQWRPIGDTHAVPGDRAPNLTPSGLDMVYYYDRPADQPGVYIAHRSSIEAWFGSPTAILPGTHTVPQLLGRCRSLYAADVEPGANPVVRRYDR